MVRPPQDRTRRPRPGRSPTPETQGLRSTGPTWAVGRSSSPSFPPWRGSWLRGRRVPRECGRGTSGEVTWPVRTWRSADLVRDPRVTRNPMSAPRGPATCAPASGALTGNRRAAQWARTRRPDPEWRGIAGRPERGEARRHRNAIPLQLGARSCLGRTPAADPFVRADEPRVLPPSPGEGPRRRTVIPTGSYGEVRGPTVIHPAIARSPDATIAPPPFATSRDEGRAGTSARRRAPA